MVDFMYSGKILALLPAANLLFLNDVKEACCEFLQKQLNPTNCLGINALADKYSCTELLSISEVYIRQHFLEVVEADEFLCLSSIQIVKLISSDKLNMFLSEKEVGGYNDETDKVLNSVECYDPTTDSWTSIAKMQVRRCSVGVRVLDGILYALGGYDGSKTLRSVETYSSSRGIWTSIADMHLCRKYSGVVALGGMLYVIGGSDGTCNLKSVEMYNPKTNTWTMLTALPYGEPCYGWTLVIDKPPYF
ncbi:kelch-like protein 3 [Acyrthosiphon pisum]|uniref:BACK domain-containing protein n=1 Tax=Acyrthosiphon pisum TaxID=7029 RepID=A0A8R2H8S9_ACYPI|nr:kelch-like protein 3 [Acyrthosiphon pisum]|eukprot:XP_016663760.1 PREDICTED: kelch-like protein 3 [Acyrthosiphon pisum]